MYFISPSDLAQIDYYWYLTKTGFVVYSNNALPLDLDRSLSNFPQLNYLSRLEIDKVELIDAKIDMVWNKRSYWFSNMYAVWFEDFYESLRVFLPSAIASSIVKRHAIKNRFFSPKNLMKWGLFDSFKSVKFLLK